MLTAGVGRGDSSRVQSAQRATLRRIGIRTVSDQIAGRYSAYLTAVAHETTARSAQCAHRYTAIRMTQPFLLIGAAARAAMIMIVLRRRVVRE